MHLLTSLLFVVALHVNNTLCEFLTLIGNSTESDIISCHRFGEIDNGNITIQLRGTEEVAVIICNDDYDLEGPPNIRCVKGQWEYYPKPSCVRRCMPPPRIRFGRLEIEGQRDDRGLYHRGALASYYCVDGYKLERNESQYRVCEKGIWTGPVAKCVTLWTVSGCQEPKEIRDGYFVVEKPRDDEKYFAGQRVHYSCKPGYTLIGSAVQQCLQEGVWSPKIQPICRPISDLLNSNSNCPILAIPNSVSAVIDGSQTEDYAKPGTVLEVRCDNNYRNTRDPCQVAKLTCLGGRWIGLHPNCVLAVGCYSPPMVEHATQVSSEPPLEDDIFLMIYRIQSQVSYQCSPGYVLEGNEILTCTSSACWYPSAPPRCVMSTGYYLDVSSVNAVLISAATGAGVLGILMLICLMVICRKKKPLTRAVPIAAPMQRPDLGDHAALLHHPALIAFADGIHNGQSSLPSYEEATRDQGLFGSTSGNSGSNRLLPRPHWPNLMVGRRSRNSPNPEVVHTARHSSFASYTPSTRSVGDSMGSTDTVAISEGSTNVTLDTASSQSGSQPASCRVHCGSLASFDTGSVVNTEGVPLLEESELEEITGGDNISLVVDNPSVSDTSSYKYSNNSTDIA